MEESLSLEVVEASTMSKSELRLFLAVLLFDKLRALEFYLAWFFLMSEFSYLFIALFLPAMFD